MTEINSFDSEAVLALYRTVLKEVCAARPLLVLPSQVIALLEDTGDADDNVSLFACRTLHSVLTKTLRGEVENLGYDPDLLPVPPAEKRLIDLSESGDTIVVYIPDADEDSIVAGQQIPGAVWDKEKRTLVFPIVHPIVEGLRGLVRNHNVSVSETATTVLRKLASEIADNPTLSNVGIFSVGADKRPRISFIIPSPRIADELKRVPSFRWDGNLNSFVAPASRLRELATMVKKVGGITFDQSALDALDSTNSPIEFDGTFEGLSKVSIDVLDSMKGKRAEKFKEFGIESLLDLVTLIPRRYLDRSNLIPIRSLQEGTEVGLLVTVANITVDPRRRLTRFTLADSTGKITATYFNAPWQAKRFRVGDEVTVYGKVESWQGSSRSMLSLTNPVMDPVGDETLAIIPIYPQSAKSRITTNEIQSSMREALRRITDLVDPLPKEYVEGLNLLERVEALRMIHLPTSISNADAARERLAFDELFRMQLALLLMKASEEAEVGVALSPSGEIVDRFIAGLPYPLTGAQVRAVNEIEKDLRSAHPMHRLLQGDVGSGKTSVSLISLLKGVECGFQGALMAPTEILASQLYAELVQRTEGLTTPEGAPIVVEFFSNKLRGKRRAEVLKALELGDIHIAVGTHALLVGDVQFNNLGVVVVDEQHRFGVEQRAVLRSKGPRIDVDGDEVHIRPHMLVMTATPIPRTAAMTVFGDLDVSVLDELPPGRTPIVTSWVDEEVDLEDSLESPWREIREQVALGYQAYVVCPLVEESEKLQVSSAVETFELLSSGALKGLRLGLVHGQQNSEERSETMKLFRDGLLDVLVATTVIEVGVNVPNATVIAILDSGRFGIAQLHQLRGRVGRGAAASSCVLVGRCKSPDSRARMEALVESTDGFYLSEVDLNLRGHGQVFGAAQSGNSDLRVASLDVDKDTIPIAREYAKKLLEVDPKLGKFDALRREVSVILGEETQAWLVKS